MVPSNRLPRDRRILDVLAYKVLVLVFSLLTWPLSSLGRSLVLFRQKGKKEERKEEEVVWDWKHQGNFLRPGSQRQKFSTLIAPMLR